jgi:hypothetical protein
MADSYNKFDLIIIIILSLLVSFIIGFNIIQLVDSKLNAITINVPPNNLQPIYLNIDKNNKLQQLLPNINDINNINNINDTISSDNQLKEFDHFGNLPDYPDAQTNSNVIASVISDNQEIEDIINEQNTELENIKDPEYNTVNNIPLLIVPDPPTPNQVVNSLSPSYYAQRVKLVENSDSPLLKMNKQKLDKISNTITKCNLINKNIPPKINGTFDGYNTYINLANDSYANITSIGKSMLTPFTSYPVPA